MINSEDDYVDGVEVMMIKWYLCDDVNEVW